MAINLHLPNWLKGPQRTPSQITKAWQSALGSSPGVPTGRPGPSGPSSLPAGVNPNVGHPGQGAKGAEYQRFRSFAERYLIARAHFFRTDAKGLKEDTWQCVLDAKVAYLMIERTGKHIDPDDGVQF